MIDETIAERAEKEIKALKFSLESLNVYPEENADQIQKNQDLLEKWKNVRSEAEMLE